MHRYQFPQGSTRRVLPRRLRREIDRRRGSAPVPAVESGRWTSPEGVPTWGSLLGEPPADCARWLVDPAGGRAFFCGWCSGCVARKLRVVLGRAWAALGADEDPSRVRSGVTETDAEYAVLRRRESRVVAFRQGTGDRRVVFFEGNGGLSERRLADALLVAALGMAGAVPPDRDPADVADRDPGAATFRASRRQIRAAAERVGYGVRWVSWGRFVFTRDDADVVMALADFVGFASELSPGYGARAAPVPAAA